MAHTNSRRDLPDDLAQFYKNGTVIPAVPLAQTASMAFDERYQRAIVRYYLDSGVGGLAVGVHTTQFEIRDPKIALYEPVLRIVQETIEDWIDDDRHCVRIAGIAGDTKQALNEAQIASSLQYDIGLVSLAALPTASNEELINHCKRIAEVIPIMGFYLQPAVGGRILSFNFWNEFAKIDGAVGIKISPFNRYQTLDVIRGVALADRLDDVALYTGNDDNIVADLLTDYTIQGPDGPITARIVGGLLGHWAVWTHSAVQIFNQIRSARDGAGLTVEKLLALGVEITDSNAALFDAANQFRGCLSGIHHVLYRQGLRQTVACLDAHERLSPGQVDEVSRIYREYPHLTDDEFVSANLDRWLSDYGSSS